MQWPIESDFFEAVQNPQFVFSDPELKSGSVRCNALGLPLPNTGAFATVYQMDCNGKKWAVRCFLREFADQQRRYTAIGQHLANAKLPSTVDFQYLPQGIRIKGNWYPILKMGWIEGETLDRYIERNLSQSSKLQQLARQWIDLVSQMRRAKLAHGDLQHGNIIVSNDQLRLIDYDGMFVPSLSGLINHEDGHRNYQHPRRKGEYNGDLDNFSAWVIFISITALSIDPRLWQTLNGGDECLIFRRDDFNQPSGSRALQVMELSGKPEIQALAAQLRALLYLGLAQIPSLDGLTWSVAGALATPPAGPPRNSALPDWLSDHVSTSTPADNESAAEVVEMLQTSDLVEEPSSQTVPAADWLFDHIVNDIPQPAILETLSLGVERMVVASGIIAVVLTTLGLAFHVAHLWVCFWIITTSLASVPLFLLRRYGRLDAVRQKKLSLHGRSAAKRATVIKEAAIKLMEADRLKAREPLIELDRKYRAVPAKRQKHIEFLNTELQAWISEKHKHLQKLVAQEAQELKRIQDQLNSAQSALNQQINRLDQERREEIATRLSALQKQHIDSRLRSTVIQVSGIGPKLKGVLASYGFRTAADVNWGCQSVPGIGPSKVNTLMAWRRRMEADAALTAPTYLPQAEEWQIKSKYAHLHGQLEPKLTQLRVQAEHERVAALNQFARYRRQLEEDEIAQRNLCAKRTEKAKTEYGLVQEQLRLEFDQLNIQTGVKCEAIERQLDELRRQLFNDRLTLFQGERECKRYERVTFRAYGSRVFSFGRN